MPKCWTIHVRFADVLYGKIVSESERLGLSLTDTVRYLLTKHFESKEETRTDGGA